VEFYGFDSGVWRVSVWFDCLCWLLGFFRFILEVAVFFSALEQLFRGFLSEIYVIRLQFHTHRVFTPCIYIKAFILKLISFNKEILD